MFSKKNEEMAVQDHRDSTNQIGKGTTLEGNIESFGNIRIEGKVVGNIKSKSKIVLGKSSFVEGNIISQNAEIEGEVKGTVKISDQLVLKSSSIINGEIETNKLIVESGAAFNGGCKMGATQEEIKISVANGKGNPEGSKPQQQAKAV